jgi:hypothetical protein
LLADAEQVFDGSRRRMNDVVFVHVDHEQERMVMAFDFSEGEGK